ncbi:MAG TPA: PHB depolymerase family esterase [Gammaproteobacteria bacterium]|nr:PHB depolymerase family esterase [Gammaproteobacteria bacterium]
MLRALYSRIRSKLAHNADARKPLSRKSALRKDKSRRRPVHGDHGCARDIEYVFRQRRYAGSRDREYLVHLPPAYRRGRRLPVVMILHGCDQDHHAIRHVAHFDRIADEHGIIVVYPFVTSYETPRMRNCWAFWSSRQNRAGAGEIEDLWQILNDVRKRFGADPGRLHVAGLSSGAAMAVALLVNRCDRIASGAEIAGLPFAETASALGQSNPRLKSVDRVAEAMDDAMGARKRQVPLLVVHAADDPVISSTAAEHIRDSWGLCFAIDTTSPVWSRSGEDRGTVWENRRYRCGDSGGLIETLLLDHSQHGWYGGRDGRYGFTDAPDVSRRVWAFLDANRLDVTGSGGIFRRGSGRRGVGRRVA